MLVTIGVLPATTGSLKISMNSTKSNTYHMVPWYDSHCLSELVHRQLWIPVFGKKSRLHTYRDHAIVCSRCVCAWRSCFYISPNCCVVTWFTHYVVISLALSGLTALLTGVGAWFVFAGRCTFAPRLLHSTMWFVMSCSKTCCMSYSKLVVRRIRDIVIRHARDLCVVLNVVVCRVRDLLCIVLVTCCVSCLSVVVCFRDLLCVVFMTCCASRSGIVVRHVRD